jgi:integrase
MAVYKQTRSNNWSYKFTWNGEQIRKSTKQTNRRIAEQIEAAHKTALAKGEVGIQSRKAIPTLKAFAPRFERAIESDCADKPATVAFYKAKLRYLLADEVLAALPINAVNEDAIDGYKQRRPKAASRRGRTLSAATINRELATLRRLLRLAHEWEVILRVPKVRLLRGERNRTFVLNYTQEAAYFAALSGDSDLHDVALLLIETGLRIGEGLSLPWTDVRLTPATGATYGYLTVRAVNSKNSKSRNVPLTSRVSGMLERRRAAGVEGLVFQRADGTRLGQTWLGKKHRDVREALGLPDEFVPHSLRHTFGTRLGESGADAFTIMKIMGHSSVMVSQRYVHPSPESVERAMGRLESLNGGKLGVGILLGIPAVDASVKSQ